MHTNFFWKKKKIKTVWLPPEDVDIIIIIDLICPYVSRFRQPLATIMIIIIIDHDDDNRRSNFCC